MVQRSAMIEITMSSSRRVKASTIADRGMRNAELLFTEPGLKGLQLAALHGREGCIHWCMSKVLTVRIAPQLLAKAEARAVQLGLDRAGYVRNLIEQDLEAAKMPARRRFASEDLAGAFRLGGVSATNPRARAMLRRRAGLKHEMHR